MPEGTIKKVITDKGFGFIEGERGDIFFHHSSLVGIAIETLSVITFGIETRSCCRVRSSLRLG